MNKTRPLNQVRSIDEDMLNHITKVQNKSMQKGSILSQLMDFASSVPDFRRSGKGNFRHQLKDIIILMILGRRSIESIHWSLDVNLSQDKIKRKTLRAARNLDTIQRIVHAVFSVWRGLRKKRSDKRKGMVELMRHISMSFTKLIHFLNQK